MGSLGQELSCDRTTNFVLSQRLGEPRLTAAQGRCLRTKGCCGGLASSARSSCDSAASFVLSVPFGCVLHAARFPLSFWREQAGGEGEFGKGAECLWGLLGQVSTPRREEHSKLSGWGWLQLAVLRFLPSWNPQVRISFLPKRRAALGSWVSFPPARRKGSRLKFCWF